MDGSLPMIEAQPAWLAELERDERRTLRTVVHTAGKDWEKLAVVDFPRRRVISGCASSGVIVHGEFALDPMGCEMSLPPLWFGHEDGKFGHQKAKDQIDHLISRSHRIGETISLLKTPTGVFIEASIDETPAGNYAWDLIRRQQANGLSVSITKLEIAGLVKGIEFVSAWALREISVCPAGGADPAAKFRIVRDENGIVWP